MSHKRNSSPTKIGGKSIPSKGNSQCEHPKPGLNSVCLENRGNCNGTEEVGRNRVQGEIRKRQERADHSTNTHSHY